MTKPIMNPYALTKPSKIPVSVLVIIYNEKQQCLLIERADKENFWQSVTGSIEVFDTDFRTTAIREVAEETGIVFDATVHTLTDLNHSIVYEIYPHWRHRYPLGTTHNTEHWFALQVPSTTDISLAPNEHTRYQWLNWQDAAQLVFSPSNQDAIVDLFTRRFPCSPST